MKKIESVCVYCASSSQLDEVYYNDATTLGQLLGDKQIHLIYGGGHRGLMGAVADGVLSHNGQAVGVIPHFMVEKGWCHNHLTEVIEVETMSDRKQLMERMGEAAIVLPGGAGTFDELMEVISLKKLGLYNHPVILLNTKGFYNYLIAFMQHSINECFMSDRLHNLWHVADTPQQVMNFIDQLPADEASLGDYAVI